ncbi:MAG: uridine kinase [Bacillota bacterium]|jgi:uridine kinase|nr:uridine kinase [Bacillota bacterium]MDK2855239.1 uridine kinase [Bacillota bacterium]MDK2924450.1 uridine kinase [Bacillota bacterium]
MGIKKDTVRVKIGTAGGEVRDFPYGTTLLAISREYEGHHPSPILAARVNGELRELTHALTEDATLEFLDLGTDDGQRIYIRSLSFLLVRAAEDVLPGAQVSIEHSLGNGLYVEVHGTRPLTEEDVVALERRMRELVEKDLPFKKLRLPLAEAQEIFRRQGQEEKAELLRYRKKDYLNVYELAGRYDYFYGYMAPSTGFLRLFALRFYLPGLILLYPSKESPGALPSYRDQPKLAAIFRESERWGEILGVSDVASLNRLIAGGYGPELIRIAEALHEKKIAQIADQITQNRERIRLVLIAGPSSSGKTTFAQRLYIQLRVNGLRPVTISLDDYFVDREHTPRDENGELDFEALEALDLKLFNRHLVQLIQGEEVEVPVFDFKRGCRTWVGRRLKVEPGQPILIEGIHGLNEKLTASIPKDKKFKVYVSALTQLNVDRHNRIPTTDTRLLRRIVRDSKYRSAQAEETILRWPSVRRGEERNIFPFQEEADALFNSALVYELAVLKRYAEPLLAAVPEKSPAYGQAKILLKFLSYFLSLDAEAEIPRTSILREFIGF